MKVALHCDPSDDDDDDDAAAGDEVWAGAGDGACVQPRPGAGGRHVHPLLPHHHLLQVLTSANL